MTSDYVFESADEAIRFLRKCCARANRLKQRRRKHGRPIGR